MCWLGWAAVFPGELCLIRRLLGTFERVVVRRHAVVGDAGVGTTIHPGVSRDVSLPHGNRGTGCGGGRGESRAEPSPEPYRALPPRWERPNAQPMTWPNLRVPLSHDLCQPFASEQFHALLNSLFKVLFNFPSRYLFAIGLVGIFSLGWSIPPVLSCTHKQLDSGETPA